MQHQAYSALVTVKGFQFPLLFTEKKKGDWFGYRLCINFSQIKAISIYGHSGVCSGTKCMIFAEMKTFKCSES